MQSHARIQFGSDLYLLIFRVESISSNNVEVERALFYYCEDAAIDRYYDHYARKWLAAWQAAYKRVEALCVKVSTSSNVLHRFVASNIRSAM